MASKDDVREPGLSQIGQAVDLNNYAIGKEAYFYKPPTMAETITRGGRRAQHIDH